MRMHYKENFTQLPRNVAVTDLVPISVKANRHFYKINKEVNMIKLMIVAGNQASKLAEHLNSTGAFRVDFVYRSLIADQEKIKNSIIKVDKLLYVYQAEEMGGQGILSIRSDMAILRNLLTSESFFSANEIIFMQKNGPLAKQASDYFNAVMKECNSDLLKSTHKRNQISFSIKTVDDTLSFQSINNFLLGVTSAEDFHNTIGKVYRYEKDSEATTAYASQDTSNSYIEPFTFRNIKDHEAERKNAVKADAGTMQYDSHEEEIASIETPKFGTLHIIKAEPVKNTFIITGENKSGKATWAAALSASSTQAKKRTLIIDYTYSGRVEKVLAKHDVAYSRIPMLNIVREPESSSGFINICRPAGKEKKVKSEFLQILYSGDIYTNFDQIFIIIDELDAAEICSIVSRMLRKIFYCVFPVEAVLDKLFEFHDTFCKYAPVMLLCSNNLKLGIKDHYEEPAALKEKLQGTVSVVAPIQFYNMNLDSTLYEKMLRG